jgi:hypothetical protein
MIRVFSVLAALRTAFMIWMLVDAIRRRAETFWYFVIFMPFGEWIYFFMVKIHDFKQLKRRLGTRAPSLDQLRFQAKDSPSLLNRLRLADGLHDSGRYDEAAGLYAEVLRQEPQNRGALHGAGLCKIELGEIDAAVTDLQQLVQLDPPFRDYRPWQDLAGALCRAGRLDEATATLRRLVATSPRLAHRVALAELLIEEGQTDEARTLLADALEEYRHAPGHQRRLVRAAVSTARRLLKRLGARQPARAKTAG